MDISNKLYCTFVTEREIESTINTITTYYSVVFNRIFVLKINEGKEYLCTYNIEPFNSNNIPLQGTILVHRKKDTNTLYTINGLNSLIRSLNNDKLDSSYKVDWQNYKNTVILTKDKQLRLLTTALYKIITLN